MEVLINKIIVVDDRDDVRKTIKRRIDRGIKEIGRGADWEVVAIEPLESLQNYVDVICDEDVGVLILDERLSEKSPVNYSGHHIVALIRPLKFDLPVYYISAVENEDHMESDRPRVQGILPQAQFLKEEAHTYVREFLLEGDRYFERTARKLSRLSELAAKGVSEQLSPEENQEVASLRKELQLPFETSTPEQEGQERAELLKAYAREVDILAEVATELEELIRKKDRGQ